MDSGQGVGGRIIDPIGILSSRGFLTEVGERAYLGLLLGQKRLIAAGITLGASIVRFGTGGS